MAPRHSSLPFELESTHASVDEATLALHAQDSFLYKVAYNYGSFGNGKVYRCLSHEACPRRLRIRQGESDSEKTFILESAGGHGTESTNKKRKGIDLSIKTEVDALLLAEGSSIKKCRLSLEEKYARQPTMLAKIPQEGQLKNRRLTLRKKNVLQVSSEGPRRKQKVLRVSSEGPWGATRNQTVKSDSETSEDTQNDGKSLLGDDETSTNRQEDVQSDGRRVENEHRDVVDVASDEDEVEEDRFDKMKLMEEFAELPGRPVFWSILKKTMFVDEETQTIATQWVTGQVIGWTTSDQSTTKWTVQFSDGDKHPFELEELVDEIRAAAELGLNVTGKPVSF